MLRWASIAPVQGPGPCAGSETALTSFVSCRGNFHRRCDYAGTSLRQPDGIVDSCENNRLAKVNQGDLPAALRAQGSRFPRSARTGGSWAVVLRNGKDLEWLQCRLSD